MTVKQKLHTYIIDFFPFAFHYNFYLFQFQFDYERAYLSAHQHDTKSSSQLLFRNIKRKATINDCSNGEESVHFAKANLSNINDLVIGYRDSLETSYYNVSQETMSNCPYGSDIYDICGNILPDDSGVFPGVCGEGSYCSSGVYGRSLTAYNSSGMTINDFPVHSVSYPLYGIIIGNLRFFAVLTMQTVYKQLCSAHSLTSIWVSTGSLFVQGILFQLYAAAQSGLFQIYPFVNNMTPGPVSDMCTEGADYYIIEEQPVSLYHAQTN